jgi:hypothetical protein
MLLFIGQFPNDLTCWSRVDIAAYSLGKLTAENFRWRYALPGLLKLQLQ